MITLEPLRKAVPEYQPHLALYLPTAEQNSVPAKAHANGFGELLPEPFIIAPTHA